MVRTKVFVGNLSFKTREPELAAAFSVAGKVASANIITRGPRSLGYGFVELESEEDAQHAVAVMNKKMIDEREINVEIAKPRDETLDRPPPRPRRPRFAKRPEDGAVGGAPQKTNSNNNSKEASPDDQAGDDPERRIRRRRRRFPARTGNSPPGQQPAQQAPQQGGLQTQGAPQQQQQQQQPLQNDQDPRRRPRRPRRPPQDPAQQQAEHPRTPSQSTLFVANLPFSVDDEGLSQIFSGLSVKSAHVVRKRNGRSKGFGFVEFDTEDAQDKAKNAIDKKVVDNRELIVKIALTENKDSNQADNNDEKKPEAKAQ